MSTSDSEAGLDRGAEAALVSPGARRFVTALRALEERGDLEPMTAVSTDDARWWSTGGDGPQTGPDGARRFWEAYRRSYADISSQFTEVTETTARAVLEWTARGHHHNGHPVRYAGTTVIDLGEPTDDQGVTGVRLYFDTSAARSTAEHDRVDDGSMLDRETAASGRNSGLAPQDGDAAQ